MHHCQNKGALWGAYTPSTSQKTTSAILGGCCPSIRSIGAKHKASCGVLGGHFCWQQPWLWWLWCQLCFVLRLLKRGWLYGMEMDSYKSWILDGVLVQKWNHTSWCLKLHASVSQSFGTKQTRSRIPGLKGEALFLKPSQVFWVCLPIVDWYQFVYTNLYYTNSQMFIYM